MRALTIRTLLLASAWWVLVEGDASSWAFGAPVVVLALVARFAMAEAGVPRVRAWGVARFLAAFVSGSVRGGLDVARRALSVRLPLSPDWMLFDLRISGHAARRLFMMVVSVMPGTLSVELAGSKLRLHVLVTTGDEVRRQVRELEARIAEAFGESVPEAG